MAGKPITGAQYRSEYKHVKAGAYLFYGDENFLKQKELFALRTKICTDENTEAFNHFVFTRDNYSADALYAAVMAVPMMSEFKLVELYELPFAEYRKKEDTEGFEAALSAVEQSDDTVLVIYTTPENFDPGEPRSPSAYMKLFSKYAVAVEFAHESTSRIAAWVQKHFGAEAIIAEPSECAYLIDSVGHDMTTLSGEIDKLCAYLHFKERDKLQRVDIDLICPRNKEIGDFEFADAVLSGDNEKVFYILGDMKMKNEPAPVILGGMIRIYTDLYTLRLCADAGISPDDAAKRIGMHPYVAKMRMARAKQCDRRALTEIIELCAEADESLKSSSADGYLLLERLIVTASQLRKRKVF